MAQQTTDHTPVRPGMAKDLRRSVSTWLTQSRLGVCGVTTAREAGNCAEGGKGSWVLPQKTWRPAILWCLDRCSQCQRCKFVSISLSEKDCSWYADCALDHVAPIIDFRSGRAERIGNISTATIVDDAPPQPTEIELRKMMAEIDQPLAATLLEHVMTGTTPGYCSRTLEGDEGDCDEGDSGTWELAPCQSSSDRLALAHCMLRCSQCARCAYYSFSTAGRDCSWFAPGQCRLDALQESPRKLPFRSGAAQPHTTARLVRLLQYTSAKLNQPWGRRNAPRRVSSHLLTPLKSARERFDTGHRHAGLAPPARTATFVGGCSLPPSVNTKPRLARCTAETIGAGQSWLVLGVFSALGGTTRRAAVRATWFRWGALAEGGAARACFVLARRAAHRPEIEAADAEARHHGDLIWLYNATEGCSGCTFTKLHEWWQWASTLPPTVRQVAKVEDDAMVHVPNLLADLEMWRATPNLYYGKFMWAGLKLSQGGGGCGFDWGGDASARARCPADSYPATPYAVGPIELLSVDLARRIADDERIKRFVRHAASYWFGGRSDEDVLVGTWVNHVQARSPDLQVTFASLGNFRSGDMHCSSKEGMYQVPRTSTILLHRVGQRQRLEYVWSVFSGCAKHNRSKCWGAVLA